MKFTESHRAVGSSRAGDGVRGPGDSGFSLLELLIVIMVLGALMTVVVVGIRGVSRSETACDQERRVVATAVEAYFASHAVDRLPEMAHADGDERGLVSASVIRDVSAFYDVAADGSLAPATGSPCS